jgi:hypothetical protein
MCQPIPTLTIGGPTEHQRIQALQIWPSPCF